MTQKNLPHVLRMFGNFPLSSFNKALSPTIKHKRVYIETLITCVICTLVRNIDIMT